MLQQSAVGIVFHLRRSLTLLKPLINFTPPAVSFTTNKSRQNVHASSYSNDDSQVETSNCKNAVEEPN